MTTPEQKKIQINWVDGSFSSIKEPAVHDADFRAAVLTERIRIHMQRHRLGTCVGPLVSAYLAALHWHFIDHRIIVSWWLSLFAVDLFSTSAASLFLRREIHDHPLRWLNVLSVSQAIAGLIWGSSVWLFATTGDNFLRYYTLMILVAVSSVSVLSFVFFRRIWGGFFVSIWLVPIIYFMQAGGFENLNIIGGIAFMAISLIVFQSFFIQFFVGGIEQSLQSFELNRQLDSAMEKIEKIATEDDLTKAYNRRFALDFLNREREIQRREKTPLAIVGIDIDHFKAINDSHGHPVGDDVLVEFTQRIHSKIRHGDALARMGGEEFLTIMPRTSLENAKIAAENLRTSIDGDPFLKDTLGLHVTASFGVTAVLPNEPLDQALSRADKALYAAKNLGRNRVEVLLGSAPVGEP